MFVVELSPEAQADISALKAFHRPPILRSLAVLAHEAELETQQRKPLAEPLEDLPGASWEIRIGDHRVLYAILPGQESRRTVRILRVILKGALTTREALSKARKR
jgi:mRNA-degrading endonuclease RelE of RelBE toxin-antitoxin system